MIAASLYFFIAVARPLPAILFGALVLSSGAAAQTIQFPALTGRVVDEAAILDAATRSELENKLAALEAKTSDQLVVVTLSSLGGRSIEEYGVALGRRWAIGQKDKNNGVLLIVAPNVTSGIAAWMAPAPSSSSQTSRRISRRRGEAMAANTDVPVSTQII